MNVILQTAQQSHPLRRGRLPAYRPVPPHPAHAFAGALVARFARRAGLWRSVGAVLAHPPTAGATVSTMVRHHVHAYSPRLRLTLAPRWQLLLPGHRAGPQPPTGRAAPDATAPLRRDPPPGADVGDVLRLVLNRPPAPSVAMHLEPGLVRHVVARTRRISLLDVPAEREATRNAGTVVRREPAPEIPAAAAVRRVVRRPAPEQAISDPQQPTREERERERNRPVPPQKPIQLDPAEINRVTDHVLRTIDRQMWARRERTGRV